MSNHGMMALELPALDAAIRCGDVAAIEWHFSHQSVRDEVAASEEVLTNYKLDPAKDPGLQLKPWFQRRSIYDVFAWNFFKTAIESHQHAVVAWLFSPTHVASLRATLGYAWPSMVRWAVENDDTEMLEVMLCVPTTGIFCEEALRDALNERLSAVRDCSVDVVRVLAAHGVDLHHDLAVKVCANAQGPEIVDVFAAEGAFIVGVALPAPTYGSVKVIGRLLELGVDCGTGSEALHCAVEDERDDLVKLYTTQARVDVDEFDEHMELTPLMLILCNLEADVTTMRLLLNAGADLSLQDPSGMTALHYAMVGGHAEVIDVLLEHGADPLQRTNAGKLPFDLLELGTGENIKIVEIFRILIRHGVVPCLNDGYSAAQVARAHAFMDEHIESLQDEWMWGPPF